MPQSPRALLALSPAQCVPPRGLSQLVTVSGTLVRGPGCRVCFLLEENSCVISTISLLGEPVSIQPQMLWAPLFLAKAGVSLRATEKQSPPPDTLGLMRRQARGKEGRVPGGSRRWNV